MYHTSYFRTMDVVLILFALMLSYFVFSIKAMQDSERKMLRQEAYDMFHHGFQAYMEKAFPADELMPLSCLGRFRGQQPHRGDIDDALGNFSLTLIDALDTLVVMGDFEEFEAGVRLVIDTVSFDQDIVVSVFETNIRIIGGLISSHILSELIRDQNVIMEWYNGQLLNMALDVAYRLLPAFNSTTGLPYPRVNLRHGTKTLQKGAKQVEETCTACAGTMILEFAALSRLSGESVFEEKAASALDVLWSSRHRMSNLMGNVLNINSGDWIRRESGVGAGIDSYYEYLAKAYILLGDKKYLRRWETHYSAVNKYIGRGQNSMLQDVHMHQPQSTSKSFVDALGAFWPGLQVLMGDVESAIRSHEVLNQVVKRHNFIPEAFTTDFQVHWGQHHLRPEFIESTYFLYRATGDDHYLDVGKKVLRNIQKHCRVTCGYATIQDIRTMDKVDRMDSFVLSETFKYLYLLFASREDIFVDIDQFIFTTEAHLLPLNLARLSNRTAVLIKKNSWTIHDEDVELARSCPSTVYLFPRDIRMRQTNLVNQTLKFDVNTKRHQKLLASEFKLNNKEHLKLIKNMGIEIVTSNDSKEIQLVHKYLNAETAELALDGVNFMRDMIELSKKNVKGKASETAIGLPETRIISFIDFEGTERRIVAGSAQFGAKLDAPGSAVTAEVIWAQPVFSCSNENLLNGDQLKGKIVIVSRGNCLFVEKARILESRGAVGGIVVDNDPNSVTAENPFFIMSGDDTDDVGIPIVFLFSDNAKIINNAMSQYNDKNALILTISKGIADVLDVSSNKNVERTLSMMDHSNVTLTFLLQTKTFSDPRVGDALLNLETDVLVNAFIGLFRQENSSSMTSTFLRFIEVISDSDFSNLNIKSAVTNSSSSNRVKQIKYFAEVVFLIEALHGVIHPISKVSSAEQNTIERIVASLKKLSSTTNDDLQRKIKIILKIIKCLLRSVDQL